MLKTEPMENWLQNSSRRADGREQAAVTVTFGIFENARKACSAMLPVPTRATLREFMVSAVVIKGNGLTSTSPAQTRKACANNSEENLC